MGFVDDVKCLTWLVIVLQVVCADQLEQYVDIATRIRNTSRDGRHVTVEFQGKMTMAATWSAEVAMGAPTMAGVPRQTWFVPITDDRTLPMNAVDQDLQDGVRQEVTQLDLDRDSWSDSQLALSYISEDGNIYYYRRIPAFDSTIGSDARPLDWHMVDRIGNHFPASVPYEEGDDIILPFDVYVNSSLQARAICVWVTYHVTGDCEISCHANVSTRYIYSDWGDATVQDDHISVTVNGTTSAIQEDDAPDSDRPNGPADVHILVQISNAQSFHGGQYVCNVYTEPFLHGASFHTQTKLLFHNATNMWPYGFILAEMSVCGNVTSLEPSDDSDEPQLQRAVIPAGLDNCLLCYGAGNPSPNITFTKDGEYLPLTSETFMVEPEEDQDFQAATYILRDVTPEDAGEYACVVNNGVTQSTHAFNITVKQM